LDAARVSISSPRGRKPLEGGDPGWLAQAATVGYDQDGLIMNGIDLLDYRCGSDDLCFE